MNEPRMHQPPTGASPGQAPGGPAEGTTPEPAPSSAHQPPPGARFMNAVRWTLFAGLVVLAAASIGSYVLARRPGAPAAHGEKKALYRCPMHPSYTSDRPGDCPICGMSLERIPEDDHPGPAAAGGVPGLSPVQLSPERIQLIGLRTARVEPAPLGGSLDLVGFVTPDESLLRRVQVRAAGWIQELRVSRVGEQVSVGQPLVSIQSPELFQSEQEFLIELATGDSLGHGEHETGATPAALQRLRLLGLPEEEIRRLERERVAVPVITLHSTVNGTVLERGVVEGQYVGADTPLFTVADLSRVWVLADLYEMDLARVKVGDRARFVADALPDRPFDGTVAFIYPTVSSETRTVKARVVLENRDGSLRPGMYGHVRVSGRGRPGLAVPTEAVIETGEASYVFLAHAGGLFEPRVIRTGVQDGDRVQVLHGLAEGDTVVASASFLIDSESRLKAAIAGLGAQPSTGHPH